MIIYPGNKIVNKKEVPNAVLADQFKSSVTLADHKEHWPMVRIFGVWLSCELEATADFAGEGSEQAFADQDEIIALARAAA